MKLDKSFPDVKKSPVPVTATTAQSGSEAAAFSSDTNELIIWSKRMISISNCISFKKITYQLPGHMINN